MEIDHESACQYWVLVCLCKSEFCPMCFMSKVLWVRWEFGLEL